MLERFGVARCCCEEPAGEPTCYINYGWETLRTPNVTNADLAASNWEIDSGSWAAKLWPGSQADLYGGTIYADYLETFDSNARIRCLDVQSQPANGLTRVTFHVAVAHSGDVAIILVAGGRVAISRAGTTIKHSGRTATCRSSLYYDSDINMWRNGFLVAAYYDATVGEHYFGVKGALDGNRAYDGPTAAMVKASTSSGTTCRFGTGTVTGRVWFGFDHGISTARTRKGDGAFLHNTDRTDGSGTQCDSVRYSECPYCPGGDRPRYMAIELSGMLEHTMASQCIAYDDSGGHFVDMTCDCTVVNGTYVVDLLPAAPNPFYEGCYAGSAQGSIDICYPYIDSGCHDGAYANYHTYHYEFGVSGGYFLLENEQWAYSVSMTESYIYPPYAYASMSRTYYSSRFSSSTACSSYVSGLPLSLEYETSRGENACDWDQLEVRISTYD